MYYTVYKITNSIDGKIYIGIHKTNDFDDGYMGSGKYLKHAINKYGIENFTKEILEVFDNPEDMFNMESKLVNEDFVKDKNTYNLKIGGCGGFDHIDNTGRVFSDETRLKLSKIWKGREHTGETKVRISSALKEIGHRPPPFYGKRHTNESKRKISKANSKHQTGKGNSNYGNCWIYCPYTHESKSIPRFDLKKWEDDGWVKGRKMES